MLYTTKIIALLVFHVFHSYIYNFVQGKRRRIKVAKNSSSESNSGSDKSGSEVLYTVTSFINNF